MAIKILVTNDDGIDAEGLRVMVDLASKIGEVTVCAPKVQQSAKSHAINIYTPFEVKKVEYEGAVEAYSVDSTPADCVRFGTLGLERDFDLVLSGVNRGLNMGEDIVYSGTLGAIFEANNRKIKAIAFSTDFTGFDSAREWVSKAYDYIVEKDMLSYAELLNVNIPMEVKGILVTKMGGAFFTDSFSEVEKDMWKQTGYCIHSNGHDLTVDTDATIDGYVTITPLQFNRTDTKAYEILKTNN